MVGPKYLVIPAVLVALALVGALVPAAATTQELAATAPTNTQLLNITDYVVKNDMAIMFNGTTSVAITRGGVTLSASNVNNITVMAGDVIHVSTNISATLVPVTPNPTPMAAEQPVATLEITPSKQVVSVTLSGGTYRIVGTPVGDPYARYLIVTEDKAPPTAWWSSSNLGSSVLLNEVVFSDFSKTFTVDSGTHTVYIGISVAVGKWKVSIYSLSAPSDNSNNQPKTASPSTTTFAKTQNSSKGGKWVPYAIAGIVVVIIAIAVVTVASAHHRR